MSLQGIWRFDPKHYDKHKNVLLREMMSAGYITALLKGVLISIIAATIIIILKG